jgi:Hsp70 protein
VRSALLICSLRPLTIICIWHERVGEPAKRLVDTDPRTTIFDFKRFIGRNFSEPEVSRGREHWPFTVEERKGKPVVKIEHKGAYKIFVSNPLLLCRILGLKLGSWALIDTRTDHCHSLDQDEGSCRGSPWRKSNPYTPHCSHWYVPALVSIHHMASFIHGLLGKLPPIMKTSTMPNARR